MTTHSSLFGALAALQPGPEPEPPAAAPTGGRSLHAELLLLDAATGSPAAASCRAAVPPDDRRPTSATAVHQEIS